MKRFLVLAVIAALTVGTSACKDTTSPGAVLAGTYTLRSANGSQLPVVVDDGAGYNRQLVAGHITIDQSGTYTDVLTYSDPGGSANSTFDDTIQGYWSLSGNELTLTDPTNPYNPEYATVANGQIIFGNYRNSAWVYSK